MAKLDNLVISRFVLLFSIKCIYTINCLAFFYVLIDEKRYFLMLLYLNIYKCM